MSKNQSEALTLRRVTGLGFTLLLKKKIEISEREQCESTPLIHITCGLKAKVGVVKIEASLPTHSRF